jgi:hypothetical protein
VGLFFDDSLPEKQLPVIDSGSHYFYDYAVFEIINCDSILYFPEYEHQEFDACD